MNIFKKRNISFIIPAYNCAKFLPDTINSIFNGNFTAGDEVIIIDDASTDKTLKIAEKLQKNILLLGFFNTIIIKVQQQLEETLVLIIQIMI